MENLFYKSSLFIGLALAISSCSTEDVDPTMNLTVADTQIIEGGSGTVVTAELNGAASEAITVNLTFSGSAVKGSDYDANANSITIAKGATSGEITITSLQDSDVEENENIVIDAESASGVQNGITSIEITLVDDDATTDSDGDGVIDAYDNCPNEAGAVENDGCPWLGFLINEVLYDPPADLPGDANGDGVRDANDDEFIEFFNSGPELDLSGYMVYDATALESNTPRHIFPEGTIVPSNGVLVLFGGGEPTGDFGGAIVQTASDGTINMSNSDDLVTVTDKEGNVVLTFDVEALSNNPDESYTRNPDLTGEFEQHAGIEGANGALFSPGTKLDGSNF